jgi:hypothetical protein
MNKCSPNNLNRDFSCFSLSELVELTQTLNKYTKKNLVLSNNKKELWNNLYKQLEPFCDNEMCWLKQDVFKKLEPELKKKLDLFTFKPKLSGLYKWLTTNDINNVMQQYQIIYPQMNYLGALPCDFPNYTNVNLNNVYDTTTLILNLDSNKGPGTHWVGVYIKDNVIEYFDSLGKKPNKCIYKTFAKLWPLYTIKYNNLVHQLRNSQCGVYSIYFIIQRLLGKSFDDITTNVIRDKEMKEFRTFLFNV